MSVEVSYYGQDGKERKLVLEEGDDTNLMFGGAKNNFTLMRSHYVDAEGKTRYEFWMKYRRPDAELHIHDFNPWRPSRPIKVNFDSERTAVFFSTQGYAGGGLSLHGWFYFGGPEAHQDGAFSLYRHIVKMYTNTSLSLPSGVDYDVAADGVYGQVYRVYNLVDVIALGLKSEAELKSSFPNNDIALVSAGKVAEVRDWEIVSNDTPEENTYYVVVENKKGDIVDVITTHGFGQTVNVGGKDYVVKYDMVIRPGR